MIMTHEDETAQVEIREVEEGWELVIDMFSDNCPDSLPQFVSVF